MRLFMRKFKQKKGESLLEALFSILLIALVSSLLLMYVQSSSKISNDAKAVFAVFGEEMSAAETREPQKNGVSNKTETVIINGSPRTVKYSGDIEENELHSYWR